MYIFVTKTIKHFCLKIKTKTKSKMPAKINTDPEWAKGLAKSLWTPHIQNTPSLNCCRLVDATEL